MQGKEPHINECVGHHTHEAPCPEILRALVHLTEISSQSTSCKNCCLAAIQAEVTRNLK